jgi:hypothetical protein
LVVFFPEKFLLRRFSATDKKYELKAFAMVNGLLDNLLFTFIVVILLVVFLLLVMVLTIFQVVFGLLDFIIRLL